MPYPQSVNGGTSNAVPAPAMRTGKVAETGLPQKDSNSATTSGCPAGSRNTNRDAAAFLPVSNPTQCGPRAGPAPPGASAPGALNQQYPQAASASKESAPHHDASEVAGANVRPPQGSGNGPNRSDEGGTATTSGAGTSTSPATKIKTEVSKK